jgi:ethanolamine ammonia-lyase small subunit
MNRELQPQPKSEIARALADLRARTPARLVVGRAGSSYRTATQLELREDHAFAVDAVHAELDIARDFDSQLVASYNLFEVGTQARDKAEFLQRPQFGRQFNDDARATILAHCLTDIDFQIVIGDGLSSAAVVSQVPALLPLLTAGAKKRNWSLGQPFVVRHCRVGILNDVGALLRPRVVVLLIGERPGLVTAESLSAYMAYRPQAGHTDAQRNLISNIHARGVPPEQAAARVLALADQMVAQQVSGVAIKEELTVNLAGKNAAGRIEAS